MFPYFSLIEYLYIWHHW